VMHVCVCACTCIRGFLMSAATLASSSIDQYTYAVSTFVLVC